ncbi:hypothetical protein [Lentzea sp. NBRC 102530]|uniref:hypothetical protein n=1 Tax=Lentzea sp. NBRC 102530 TaxID=3032201 RepID=UPI00255609D3|nr:hypothetical protein [Lentzea sp. NBRC 102530]
MAATAAVALLLGLTTSAGARAADPRQPAGTPQVASAGTPEATAVGYSYAGGQESVTIENQHWVVASHESGRTSAHPGWDVHLSDEKLGAGLPRQNFAVRAGLNGGTAFATAGGFLSIIDQNRYDVPFLVVKLPSRSVTCGDFSEVPLNGPRVFVRKWDGELHEADRNAVARAESVTPATSATDTTTSDISVEVKPVSTTAQLTAHTPFQKYAGRNVVRQSGHEITLKVHGQSGTTVLSLLAGAVAVSC